MNEIKLIVGDSLEQAFRITNDGEPVTDGQAGHVFFTCAKLGLQQELSYLLETQEWLLSIPAARSGAFSPIVSSYDVTVFFTDGRVDTAVHEGTLRVLPKRNAVAL